MKLIVVARKQTIQQKMCKRQLKKLCDNGRVVYFIFSINYNNKVDKDDKNKTPF